MKTPDVSVIIVTYNTKDLTDEAIRAVKKSDLGRCTVEIIVYDNASSDGTPDMMRTSHPDVLYMRGGKNLGFAGANNRAIKRSRGRYVLLLNSDTEVAPDAIAGMLAMMDGDPSIGASTCKLMLRDGSMDPACHRGFPTPWSAFAYMTKLSRLFPKSTCLSGYHQTYKDMSTVHEVDAISGAFFLVPREVIRKVGLLDEDFFMYGEDIDWAYRIKHAGYRIVFNPGFRTLHKKKQSGRAKKTDIRIRTERMFYSTMLQFYDKHYKDRYPQIVRVIIASVIRVRMAFVPYLR